MERGILFGYSLPQLKNPFEHFSYGRKLSGAEKKRRSVRNKMARKSRKK